MSVSQATVDYVVRSRARNEYRRNANFNVQAIARKLHTGGHFEKYGVESAQAIVKRIVHERTLSPVVRPSSQLVRYQKANSALTQQQSKVRSSQDLSATLAHQLHEANKAIESAKASLASASNRAERQKAKGLLRAIKYNAGL